MTPPESPRPDADPQDEALAAVYRQAAREEPSPRQDAAILAAAAAELARPAPQSRPRAGWWARWRVGLSLAATVLLSAGLVLLVEREQARDDTREAAPAAREATAPVAPPALQAPADAAPAPRPAPPPAGSQERSSAGLRDAAPPPARPPRQEADTTSAPAAKAKAEAPAAAVAPAPAAPAPFPAAPEMRQDAERGLSGNVAREAAQRTPQAWLAEIRALLQAGREAEARAAVQAFVHRHPDISLPADLEALRPPEK